VIFGQSPKLGESIRVDFGDTLANAAQESFSRGAERTVSPARILLPGTALLSLQYPLQRVVNDPPALIELRYEPIGRVR